MAAPHGGTGNDSTSPGGKQFHVGIALNRCGRASLDARVRTLVRHEIEPDAVLKQLQTRQHERESLRGLDRLLDDPVTLEPVI
jgi:hypothetical protein